NLDVSRKLRTNAAHPPAPDSPGNDEGAGAELEARHPPLTLGDGWRQPATTATSSSVVTSGWRRTVTECLPTVLIWAGTSTARRSRAGPPAARTASTTSEAVTEPNSRPESPAALALTVTARSPS